MRILDVLRQPIYLSIAVVLSVFMFLFLPYVQTLGIATDLWYTAAPTLNLVLFVVFSLIFGVFVSFQIFGLRQPKVCPVNVGGTAGGFAGSAFAFIVGVCPACFGFASLILPLSITTTLTVFGPIFILLSICLMVYSIHLNGGFKN